MVRDFKETSAYNYGSIVGRVLDTVLERGSPLIKTTRLSRNHSRLALSEETRRSISRPCTKSKRGR